MTRTLMSVTVIALCLVAAVPSFGEAIEGQEALKTAFLDRWELYFGKPPQAQVQDRQEGPVSAETVFRSLWQAYSPYLPLEERSTAESVFRYYVLGDRKVLLGALNASFYNSQLYPARNGGMLFYLFLEEELQDRSVMQQALPPGPDGSRMLETLALFGEDEQKVRTRMAAFMLRSMVEQNVFRGVRNDLPLVWTSTKGLGPSEALIGRIVTSEEYAFIRGELSGRLDPLKLIFVFSDMSCRVSRSGVANARDGQLVIPSGQGMLFVAVFNNSREDVDEPFSATFWKEYNPPVSIVSASQEGGLFRLTLDESSGILAYRLEVRGEGEKDRSAAETPLVRSAGKGINDYLFSSPRPDQQQKAVLRVYTLGGFAFSLPVQMEK